MVNLRWGLTAGIAAFFISIALGLFSGVSVLFVFLRAFVFMLLFFGVGFGLHVLVNTLFPELLYASGETAFQHDPYEQDVPRVTVSLDRNGEYAVPELFKTSGDDQEMGNIEDLISGSFKPAHEESEPEGIDRKRESGYNNIGSINIPEEDNIDFDDVETSSFEKAPVERPAFTPSFGDDSGLGGLPDLDMMAMAFSGEPHVGGGVSGGFSAPEPAAAADSMDFGGFSSEPMVTPSFQSEEIEPPQSGYVGNKPQPLEGDFDPQQLAEGIRTVLNKDK